MLVCAGRTFGAEWPKQRQDAQRKPWLWPCQRMISSATGYGSTVGKHCRHRGATIRVLAICTFCSRLFLSSDIFFTYE